jgi:hypothetical protein
LPVSELQAMPGVSDAQVVLRGNRRTADQIFARRAEPRGRDSVSPKNRLN